MSEISNAFVVVMGIGTVFIGLICIIIICKIIGLFCIAGAKKKPEDKPSNANAVSSSSNENRQEILAAVTAACAEDMGKDISALRVVSFKKI
ncbi:MAG: OadG family protein [Clostridia bacterium]|nr:OadG family protein [Clostridia bacterium]